MYRHTQNKSHDSSTSITWHVHMIPCETHVLYNWRDFKFGGGEVAVDNGIHKGCLWVRVWFNPFHTTAVCVESHCAMGSSHNGIPIRRQSGLIWEQAAPSDNPIELRAVQVFGSGLQSNWLQSPLGLWAGAGDTVTELGKSYGNMCCDLNALSIYMYMKSMVIYDYYNMYMYVYVHVHGYTCTCSYTKSNVFDIMKIYCYEYMYMYMYVSLYTCTFMTVQLCTQCMHGSTFTGISYVYIHIHLYERGCPSLSEMWVTGYKTSQLGPSGLSILQRLSSSHECPLSEAPLYHIEPYNTITDMYRCYTYM